MQDPPSQLPEIVVEGGPVEERARSFIGEIAAPSRGQSLARWRRTVCIGAAGFDTEGARFIIDRVSAVATDLGITPEAPGCEPNILIVASNDGHSTAREMVELKRARFLPGGIGFSRTRADLAGFIDADRAVRWWHTTRPIDTRLDQRTRKLPTDGGFDNGPTSVRLDNLPQIIVPPSLIAPTSRQDLWNATVIVDFSRIGGVDYNQLADYIALVALAQVDPEADTSTFPTVLNVFDNPASAYGLTDWDRAYLRGLYDSGEAFSGANAREGEVRRTMLRALAERPTTPAD